ncbi:Hect e3 ubiquitin, partial [Globisporangium splendens]
MGQPESTLTANSAGYTLPGAASSSSSKTPARWSRLDMRWSRLTIDQLRDEEFLTKQLRRTEALAGADARRHAAAAGGTMTSASSAASNGRDAVFVNATPSRSSFQQRLLYGKADSPSPLGEQGEEGSMTGIEGESSALTAKRTRGVDGSRDLESMKKEQDLLNALYLLGDLEQPELAALVLHKLQEALLRCCTFPDPCYELLALKSYCGKHPERFGTSSATTSVTIFKSDVCDSARSGQTASGVTFGGSTLPSIKPKEEMTREASMGIQVVFSLFASVLDQASSSLTQKKEFLTELLPLIKSLPPQALTPTNCSIPSGSLGTATAATASAATSDLRELVDRIQRFLLGICPLPPLKHGPSSPKVHAVTPSLNGFDVTDRTNAVNGLIYLAAARNSLRDFLIAMKVILGAHESCCDAKDTHSARLSSPLTASISLLKTKVEDQHSTNSVQSEWDKDEVAAHPIAHHRPSGPQGAGMTNAAVGVYKSNMKEDLKELLQIGNGGFLWIFPWYKRVDLVMALLRRQIGMTVVSDGMILPGQDDCEDKEVWSCGQNSYGGLGHGDTITRKSFDRIEALQRKDVVQVSAGNEHSIVLCGDSTVLTCGYNDNGQCGVGMTNRVSNVTEIRKFGDHAISQVHAYNGCEHSVVVTQDGRAATLGYNYRGQLGHGNTTSENVPKLIRSLEGRIVRLVSCSYYHTILTCGDTGAGRQFVYTFGRSDYGQLGHNDTIDRKVPHHIDALADQHIVSVACGQYHTMVVSSTGKAYGFGKNDYGQLGTESTENQLAPVQVRNGLEKQVCLEIRCGYYHTIVLCSGAHLYGFGRNDYGQLGLGKANATAAANLQLQQQRFAFPQLTEELEGKEIIRFACGCYHTIAVSDNGVLFVFGRNNHGQLGTNDTNERVYPFPIEDFLGKRIAMVAAGFYHTIVLTGGKEEEKGDQDGGPGNMDDENVGGNLRGPSVLSPHMPLPMSSSGDAAPFSLVLPPCRPSCSTGSGTWQHDRECPSNTLKIDEYRSVFGEDSIRNFLSCLSGRLVGDCCAKARLLCDWIRDHYAKSNGSYRMLVRQSKASTKSDSTVDTESHIEYAAFAAGNWSASKPPPRVFLILWHIVAELRRRFSAKKTEIKNSGSADPLLDVANMQQTVIDRCQLLLVVAIQDEEQHLQYCVDGEFVAAWDPAFCETGRKFVRFPGQSLQNHMQATYEACQLPFLSVFPESRWRKVRILFHVVARWKWIGSVRHRAESLKNSGISREILDFVTTDEPVSTDSAVSTLLIDPSHRASCSSRGFESLCELPSISSFESIQTNIIHRTSHILVFQSSCNIGSVARTKCTNTCLFYKETYSSAFSEFLTQVTQLIVEKSSVLFSVSESESAVDCHPLITMLSCWILHFQDDHFDFVNKVGILGLLQETMKCIGLDLAISVWKHLAGEVETDSADQEEAALQNLKEVDFVVYTLWKSMRAMLNEYQKLQASDVPRDDRRFQDLEEQLEAMDLTFTVFLSDGQIMELGDGGAEKVVTLGNLEAYLTAVIRARMDESNDVLNIIKQGLNSILPVAALSLYTWKELEKRVCGVAEVDVNLLKQNTEYDEDVSAQDEFVQRFWRVLASMEEEDKRSFLRFVWARSRLPAGTAQFHQKFKIQSLSPTSNGGAVNGESSGSSSASGGWMDSQLPKSHTCFFALQLPRYSTDEICRKQMLYAIRNCVEMDGDFRLADTEMTGWNDINPNDQLRF